MKQDILLIGATSPVGRAVSTELLARGHNVVPTSRSSEAGFEQLDVADQAQTLQVLERVRPSAVVYLARPDLEHCGNAPAAVESAVATLHRFAVDCVQLDVDRLIFASSAAVYGTRDATPRHEDDELHADSSYAELKLRSEEALSEVAASTSLSTLALRIFNVYGPGLSNSLVNRLALSNRPSPFVRDTELFVRDYIHVADVAWAFGAAADAQSFDRATLNVGTGIGTSNRTLLQLCPNAVYEDDPRAEVGSFSIADISLIEALWRFQPQTSVDSALRTPAKFLR